ncbi:hypothetical protein BH09SUM1_BH09SUM1_13550 [soil metagenome]
MNVRRLIYSAGVAAILAAPMCASATIFTTLAFPARPAGAMTGTQFYNSVKTSTKAQREAAILAQAQLGNVPDFLRTLKPITVTATINSVQHTATYYVAPDYFAIGSDADFFRVPMSGTMSQQICDLVNCNLPTRKMVNDIYANATVKLEPYPFSPATYTIDSIDVMWASNVKIEEQRATANGQLGQIIMGIKKDVVVTDELDNRPSPLRVAIYGWHYPPTHNPSSLANTAIQPLSLVHEVTYCDYSHGAKLVAQPMLYDGVETTVAAVIADPARTKMLNDEAVAYSTTRYATPTTPTPTPPPVTSLLINGNFENFPASGVAPSWTSWTASASPTVAFGRASVNKVDGSYSQYWSVGTTAAYDAAVYQRVTTVTALGIYRLRGSMKRQSTFTGTLAQVGVDLSGGTAPLASGVQWTNVTGATDDVWNAMDQVYTATGPALTVFLRGGHTGTTPGANAYYYVDAFTLVQTGTATPTATPAATPSPATSAIMLN